MVVLTTFFDRYAHKFRDFIAYAIILKYISAVRYLYSKLDRGHDDPQRTRCYT